MESRAPGNGEMSVFANAAMVVRMRLDLAMKEAVKKGLSFEEFFDTSGLPEFEYIKRGTQVWRIPMRRDLKVVYEEFVKSYAPKPH